MAWSYANMDSHCMHKQPKSYFLYHHPFNIFRPLLVFIVLWYACSSKLKVDSDELCWFSPPREVQSWVWNGGCKCIPKSGWLPTCLWSNVCSRAQGIYALVSILISWYQVDTVIDCVRSQALVRVHIYVLYIPFIGLIKFYVYIVITGGGLTLPVFSVIFMTLWSLLTKTRT